MARKMKDSGVQWIGVIPATWQLSRIKYIAEFEPKCDFSSLNPDDTITYTPMECIKNGYYVPNTALLGSISPSLTSYQENDIVMAKVTPCFENGNIAVMKDLASGVGLGSSELFVFRAKYISTKYLFYWLQNFAFTERAKSTMTGTGGLKRVSPQYIKNCEIHVPPVEEQNRITSFFDTECARIDAVIEKTRTSIEEYKRLKQAVITQTVTKGIRPERPMKETGNNWIPTIPTEWQLTRVGLHFDITLGKMLCTNKLSDDYTLEPYYCAANVHFDGVTNDGLKQMWFSSSEKKQYLVSVGDLLVVEGGAGAGGCAVVKEMQQSAYIQNSIMIVRPRKNSNNRYLGYLLESLVKSGYIDVACNKATIPHFTKDKLANVPFPISSEQEEIADYLDAQLKNVDVLISKKESLLTELDRYKKTLIFEYVTGKKEVLA